MIQSLFNKTFKVLGSTIKTSTAVCTFATNAIIKSCDVIQSGALMISLPVKVTVAVLKTLNLESRIDYYPIKVVSDEITLSTKKIETLIIDQFNEKTNYLKTLLNNSKSDTEGNILTKLRENLNKEGINTKEMKFNILDTDANNEALDAITNFNKAIEKVQETAKMITNLAKDLEYATSAGAYYAHSGYVYITKKPIEQTAECSESHIVKTADGDEFCAFSALPDSAAENDQSAACSTNDNLDYKLNTVKTADGDEFCEVSAVDSAQNFEKNNHFGADCAANDNMEVQLIGGELIESAA